MRRSVNLSTAISFAYICLAAFHVRSASSSSASDPPPDNHRTRPHIITGDLLTSATYPVSSFDGEWTSPSGTRFSLSALIGRDVLVTSLSGTVTFAISKNIETACGMEQPRAAACVTYDASGMRVNTGMLETMAAAEEGGAGWMEMEEMEMDVLVVAGEESGKNGVKSMNSVNTNKNGNGGKEGGKGSRREVSTVTLRELTQADVLISEGLRTGAKSLDEARNSLSTSSLATGFEVTYHHGDSCPKGRWHTSIRFFCDKDGDMENPNEAIIAKDRCEVLVIWRSPLGCGKTTGLGAGWAFVISVVIVVSLYLGIGTVIKSSRTGAKGIESLPHADFWRNLPGLVADGCVFAYSMIKAKLTGEGVSTNNEYEPIP